MNKKRGQMRKNHILINMCIIFIFKWAIFFHSQKQLYHYIEFLRIQGGFDISVDSFRGGAPVYLDPCNSRRSDPWHCWPYPEFRLGKTLGSNKMKPQNIPNITNNWGMGRNGYVQDLGTRLNCHQKIAKIGPILWNWWCPISPTRLVFHSRTRWNLRNKSGVFPQNAATRKCWSRFCTHPWKMNPSSHVPSFNCRHRAKMIDVKKIAKYFHQKLTTFVLFGCCVAKTDHMNTKCTKRHMQNWLRYAHKAKQRQSQSGVWQKQIVGVCSWNMD